MDQSTLSKDERTLAGLAHGSILLGTFTSGMGGIIAALIIIPRLVAEIADLAKNYQPLVSAAQALYENSFAGLQSSLPRRF